MPVSQRVKPPRLAGPRDDWRVLASNKISGVVVSRPSNDDTKLCFPVGEQQTGEPVVSRTSVHGATPRALFAS